MTSPCSPDRAGVPALARRGRLAELVPEPRQRGTSARAERTARQRRRTSAAPGYLRSRGEDVTPDGTTLPAAGVPPLARRGHSYQCRCGWVHRGTSARAERTRRPGRSCGPAPGYLRSRGEDPLGAGHETHKVGVPPLARRGRFQLIAHPSQPRGTSARAERTRTRSRRPAARAGYLRSRGEDASGSVSQRLQTGVPPLARRGLGHPRPALPELRGTSARAERTLERIGTMRRSVGYLRSRGEDRTRARGWPSPGGVPPLARRGPVPHRDPAPLHRGTSARAERTTPRPQTPLCRPGYLRSRGEDSSSACRSASSAGVPPLARRGPAKAEAEAERRRGTSARAERTLRDLRRHPLFAVSLLPSVSLKAMRTRPSKSTAERRCGPAVRTV